MKLSSWPLRCEMFDGDLLDGPVPTLFAEDEEAAVEAISKAPEKVKCNKERKKYYFSYVS